MRYLIDTCIFTTYVTDIESLSRDALAIIEDYDNSICMSSESLRELIVSFNNGEIVSKFWDTAHHMIDAILNEFCIAILPLKEEHMYTYSDLEINLAQKHKDPSDHVIISHAITERLPLLSSDNKFEFYRKQGLDFVYTPKR